MKLTKAKKQFLFCLLFIFLAWFLFISSKAFAETAVSNDADRISVSEQQSKSYKNVAKTALNISMSKSYLPFGPHQGPGFLTGVGPILQITWFKENKEISYEKFVPIAAIISMDKIFTEYNIVFYKGSFERTEYAIASDEIFEKIKGRWINYLVSQEPSSVKY